MAEEIRQARNNQPENEGQREANDTNHRSLKDYISPMVDVGVNSIVRPEVDAQNFEIKPSFIQWLQSTCQFRGGRSE